MSIALDGAGVRAVSGQVLTAQAMDAQNDFDAAPDVTPQPFLDARLSGGLLTATLPAKSLVVLTLD